jgi:GT2 family glycosyltransferase
MQVSIVIPVFNKFNFTKSCLNDLKPLKGNCEVVVVDNGSSDETKSQLEDNKDIVYIRNDVNYGFAKACNIGFAKSTGKYVMFLNNDIRVKEKHNTWPIHIISEIENDRNCIVGPTGGYVDPKDDFKFVYESHNDGRKINYMSGWCLTAYRDTWDKLIINDYCGPFSEEFGLAYFEDTDLSFRATRQGIGFKLVDIPVVHFGKISSSQINTYELYNKARRIFINKWGKHDIRK